VEGSAVEATRRGRIFRAFQGAATALAAALFLVEVPGIPFSRWPEMLFFTALAVLGFRLRVRYAGNYLGLEAAALVPAILILRSPGAVILICVAADTLAKLIGGSRRVTSSTGFDLAQLSLSYGLAAAFLQALPSGDPGLVNLITLTVGGLVVYYFVNTLLVFTYLDLGRLAPRDRLLEIGLFQLVALLLLVPIVLLEVLAYPHYGVLGVLLAFFPVILASVVMRNLSSVEKKYEEVARRNRELDVMREIARLFASQTGQARYDRLFDAIRRILPVEAMAFIEWPEDASEQATIYLAGQATVSRERVAEWIRESRFEEPTVQASAEPVERRTGPERVLELAPHTTFQVALRIATVELDSGRMVLEGVSPALHSPSTLGSLGVLAEHVALVLQDSAIRLQINKLSDRNRERAETLREILEVSNDLKRQLDLDSLFQSIVGAAAKSLGFNVVVLSLYDRDRNVLVHRAQYGIDRQWPELQDREVPAAEITRQWTEANRVSRSYFVRNRTTQDLGPYDIVAPRAQRRPRSGWGPHDILWIPLASGDRLVGCLSVDDPRSGEAPSIETIRALEIFANQAVTAIESTRTYQDAREQSIRDWLTGAYNHRHFQEVLQREVGRAERSGRPLTILMLDIDDFKSVNDRYGHPVGDAVLQGIVSEILHEVRGDMDVVARYGGEEFAIILPETPTGLAASVAERVRKRVDERLFRPPGSDDVLRVTVSIGLATYPRDASSKRELIEKADAALYSAKRSGKNAVTLHSPSSEGPRPTLPH
jgi:diguanylate cyclase (GGDEF)-like protein